MKIDKILRQKRRLFVLIVGAMLAHAIHQGPGPAALGSAIAALLVGVAIIAATPRYRRLIEVSGLALPLAAFVPLPGSALPAVFLVCASLVYLIVYGKSADAMPFRLGLVSKRKSLVQQPAIHTWAALVPGVSHPDDYWSGNLIDFDSDPDDPDTVYLRFETGDPLCEEKTVTFVDRTPYRFAHFLIESDHGDFSDEVMMQFRLEEPSVGECLIHSRLEQEAIPPRIAMERWFDDRFGDELDSFARTMSRERKWSLHRPKTLEDATA